MISVRGKPSFSLERLKTMFPCKSRMVHLNMAPLMSTPANRCDSGISSSSIGGLPPLDIPFPASLISPSSISSSVMFIMVGILKPVSLASSALYIEWFLRIKSKSYFYYRSASIFYFAYQFPNPLIIYRPSRSLDLLRRSGTRSN